LKRLYQGLAERRLPSLAMSGRRGLERGALFGLAPDNIKAVARRAALNVHFIALGQPLDELPVYLPMAMGLLSLILIVQSNSIRRFAIIMLTIPPMLIGVVPGLLLTGSTFGFMTLLGMIALLGIIVNNAILLIDEINLQLEQGLPLTDAIVTVCRSRLRPILLTTCTTVIGLLPLAISGGGMWSSMAFAMIFGLSFATALTLMLCPALFYLLFRRTYPES
jgi:multidrug efflux pump subunit AcrB